MIGVSLQQVLEQGFPPSFDDIMIVPSNSSVRSRREPDTSNVICSTISLEVPIISSPMDTVTGSRMAQTMSENGGMGILHRFLSKEEQARMIELLLSSKEDSLYGTVKIVPAIGVGRAEKERFDYLLNRFHNKLTAVAIDVANGDSSYMRDMIRWVRSVAGENLPIIAGNVATGDGFIRLAEAGANAVRVGIGGGSICKTRIMTGIGVPTLASVADCYIKRAAKPEYSQVSIIADGGGTGTGIRAALNPDSFFWDLSASTKWWDWLAGGSGDEEDFLFFSTILLNNNLFL